MTSSSYVAFELVAILDSCVDRPNFLVHKNIANALAAKIGRSDNPLACLDEIA